MHAATFIAEIARAQQLQPYVAAASLPYIVLRSGNAADVMAPHQSSLCVITPTVGSRIINISRAVVIMCLCRLEILVDNFLCFLFQHCEVKNR